MVLLIVNKILRIVIADYGTQYGILDNGNQALILCCIESIVIG